MSLITDFIRDELVEHFHGEYEGLNEPTLLQLQYIKQIVTAQIIDIEMQSNCEHKWIDATNEVVSGGLMCEKCYTVKAI